MRYFIFLTFALFVAVSRVQAENAAALSEVLKLKNAGVNEETIVAFIRSKNVNYDLSSDNIITLRDKGLTESVLNAMLSSGKDASTPIITPAPAPALAPSIQTLPGPLPQTAVPPAGPTQSAVGADAPYFYQELSPHGSWILAEDNQWYWRPTVAVSNPSWRPYWDQGHWVYTDYGWYWASDYPWGWAAFHYGRWHLHPHHGWIWFPDRMWGPAWVVWRSGGAYCGWAPLPPGVVYDPVAARFAFHGRRVDVNFDFGLEWSHFNFCLVRELGDRPRQRFHGEEEIHNLYKQTTVINNYTVVKAAGVNEAHAHIVNHGIDPTHVASVKGHTVETLKIQDLRTPTPARSHERLNTRNNTLEVYRPKLKGYKEP